MSENETEGKVYNRFRLLAGFHIENKIAIKPGKVFESPHNLLVFNAPSAVKFEQVHPSTPLGVVVYKSGGKLSAGQLSAEEIAKQREALELRNQLDEKEAENERLRQQLENARLNSPQVVTEEQALPVDDPFEGMNINELRAYASDNEIDISGASKKDEIKAILMAHLEVEEVDAE